MDQFVVWWFTNVSYPFQNVANENLPAYGCVMFLLTSIGSVWYFSKHHDKFYWIIFISVLIGIVSTIFSFFFVLFLPFFLVIFGGAAAFVWICKLIFDSVRGKEG